MRNPPSFFYRTMPLPHILIGSRQSPALIFLHGFLGRGKDWQTIASCLAESYYCLLPDLPGHGVNVGIGYAHGASFSWISRQIQALIEEYHLVKPALIGYSMGGRIALHTALQFPHHFSQLVLESCHPGLSQPLERQKRAALDAHRAQQLMKMGMRAFMEEWYAMPLFASLQQRPRLLAEMIRRRSENQPAEVASIIRELSPGIQPDHWSELPTLKIPTLLVGGHLDPKYPAILQQMHAALPQSQLTIFPHAGHNIHAEQRQQFIHTLQNFLQEIRQ